MSLLYTPNFKYPQSELRKNQEFMDSSHHYQEENDHQHNSGLMRYRSAPSSFFESLANGSSGGVNNSEDYRYFRSSSPEMDGFLAKYMLPCNGSGDSGSHDLQEFGEKAMKQEDAGPVPQQTGYSNVSSQMIYQSLPTHNLTNDNSVSVGSTMDTSFGAVNHSMRLENSIQAKMGAGNGSNLARQNSSPPGLFSNLGVDNGFNVMRDVGCFRASNGTNGEASPSGSRLNNRINFSSGSSSRLMPQIGEIGSQSMGTSSPEKNLVSNNGSTRQYMSNFSTDSWDDTSFSGLNRARDHDGSMFFGLSTLETQNGNSGHQPTRLTHHLSLPKTSAEMATVEKLLQFQGSVPCKIRAKRGCATHPRSIAERVRRTRISERMRKLQELFPNMDKQTNTADMLDLAVEYIKNLQKEVKTLMDTRSKCKCSSKQKPY
ncbi:hypothetical protein Patl1_17241 [Pistacia atlantica]|uniref:Uncharacterized protein n=1 Tax=Pistacia atlantica TaxID=434234 RepID=A0ACC1BAQ1_9ROSI|nr:hypothetical protein Patl1_17241 [Pistacia atlantica]